MRQLLNWFRRGDLERGLDRELGYHVDRRVSDLMHAGLPEQEARRQARLELGGLTQVREEVRDVWLTRWLRDFVQDLRFSARSFCPHSVVHGDRRAFAGTRHWSDDGDLLPGGSGAAARASGPRTESTGPDRLEGRSGGQSGFGSWNLMSYPICRDLQLQDRFFDGVLCRAATTVNLSTGGRAETGGCGNRLRQLFFGAGSESGDREAGGWRR